MRISLLAAVAAVAWGCGPPEKAKPNPTAKDFLGTYAGKVIMEAMAKGCPDIPWSFTVELNLSMDSVNRLRIDAGPKAPLLTGAMGDDGWYAAEADGEVDASNWGYTYQDGLADGSRLRGTEFFDGAIGGRTCWYVSSFDLARR